MCPVATALLSIRSELELLLEQLRQSTTPIQWDELTSAVLHGWLPWPLEDATRQRLTMEGWEAPSLSGAHAEMLAAMRAPVSRRQPRPHWLPPPPAPWAEIHVWLQGRAVQGTRQASHPARGQWGALACLAGCSSTRATFVDLDLKHTSRAIAASFALYASSCCTSIACTAIIVCFKLHLPLAKDTKKAAQTSQGRPQSQLALLLVRQSFRASAISTLSRIRLLAPKLPSLSHAAVEAAAQSPSIGQSLNGNRHRTKPTSPTLCLAPWHTLVI